jgi:hypothetical protein
MVDYTCSLATFEGFLSFCMDALSGLLLQLRYSWKITSSEGEAAAT